ncbi:MAG: flagellar assembly protein FliX [Rhodospirillaceae bacterium]
MKVSNVGPGRGVDKAKKKQGTSSSSDAFANDLKEVTGGNAPKSAGAVSGSVVAGVDAVLAAQQVGDATQGRSRGLLIDRGNKLLESLEGLQVALLSGDLPKEKVVELAQTLREKRPPSEDPGLNDILDEIELRAEVELAKLTRR